MRRSSLPSCARVFHSSINRLLDRIVESTSDAVVSAFEKRIEEDERKKLVLIEKIATGPGPKGKFEELFELALTFLGNPMNLRETGRFEYRQLVLRMTFSNRLAYGAKTGFRTPETTLPFNILSDIGAGFSGLAERKSGH